MTIEYWSGNLNVRLAARAQQDGRFSPIAHITRYAAWRTERRTKTFDADFGTESEAQEHAHAWAVKHYPPHVPARRP